MSTDKLPEMTFKPGEYVWTPAAGFVVLRDNLAYETDPYQITDGALGYTSDGKISTGSKGRTILTIEEARKLGLEPPRRTRKERRYGWISEQGDVLFTPIEKVAERKWSRAPWLDGEVEFEIRAATRDMLGMPPETPEETARYARMAALRRTIEDAQAELAELEGVE